MYFTKAQIRGLWLIIGLMMAALTFQYAKYYAQSREFHDFTSFDSVFISRRDSILNNSLSPDTITPQYYRQQKSVQSESVVIQQFPININKATSEELQVLPRIGPAMAKRIIEYRQINGPFREAVDIMKVRGIGEKTYLKLQDLIKVD